MALIPTENILQVLVLVIGRNTDNFMAMSSIYMNTFTFCLQKICPELKRLLASKHESFVLKCWGILVQIFGEVS